MNRAINFRAWDPEEKIMSIVDILNLKEQTVETDDDCLSMAYSPEAPLEPECVLMQFTGLRDAKGVEIYEGDIVQGVVAMPQLLTSDTDDNSNFKMTGEVCYDRPSFMLKVIQNRCAKARDGMVNYFSFISDDGAVFEDMKIVGNIYENPELLK